jgi:hypothetical protein
MAKPWEKETYDFTAEGKKPKKPPRKKKPKKPAGPGSIAEDIHDELVGRNKELAPYAETGPGASKKKKRKKY